MTPADALSFNIPPPSPPPHHHPRRSGCRRPTCCVPRRSDELIEGSPANPKWQDSRKAHSLLGRQQSPIPGSPLLGPHPQVSLSLHSLSFLPALLFCLSPSLSLFHTICFYTCVPIPSLLFFSLPFNPTFLDRPLSPCHFTPRVLHLFVLRAFPPLTSKRRTRTKAQVVQRRGICPPNNPHPIPLHLWHCFAHSASYYSLSLATRGHLSCECARPIYRSCV